MATSTQNRAAISRNLEITGLLLIRYGVVLILFWIGLLKFTSYEANGVCRKQSIHELDVQCMERSSSFKCHWSG